MAVVARGARLPHRCFRCNIAAEESVPFLLKWAEPEERGKALARDLIEKTREEQILVTAYVCPRHARRMRLGWNLGLTIMLCGVAVFVLALAFEVCQVYTDYEGPATLTAIALAFVGYAVRRLRIGMLKPGYIDRDRAVVFGFRPAFLDSLPSWAEASVARVERAAAHLERLTD